MALFNRETGKTVEQLDEEIKHVVVEAARRKSHGLTTEDQEYRLQGLRAARGENN